jgi:prepilin-type N-terminal cleavage/methylation domain-containing protein
MVRSSSKAARQRGFSFIEILVVMGIISVLVGGVIVAIGMWAEKGPEFATKNTLNKTKALIENWKAQFEMWPPSDLTRIADVAGVGTKAESPGNKTNEGIEAIYQALYWPGYKGDPQWKEADPGEQGGEIGNTDEDELKKPVNKRGTKELKEIIDGYGNPLVYFNRDDYVKYAEGGARYVSQDKDLNVLDVEPKPYRNDDGTYVNPDSFQLFSMGPDGEPNTDDDITTWK